MSGAFLVIVDPVGEEAFRFRFRSVQGHAHRRWRVDTARSAQSRKLAFTLEILVGTWSGITELDRVPIRQLLLAGAGFEFGFEHELGLLCGDDLAFGEAHVALHGVHLERQRQ